MKQFRTEDPQLWHDQSTSLLSSALYTSTDTFFVCKGKKTII